MPFEYLSSSLGRKWREILAILERSTTKFFRFSCIESILLTVTIRERVANQAGDPLDASNVYFEASYKDVALVEDSQIFGNSRMKEFYEPLVGEENEVCFDTETYANVGSFVSLINRVSATNIRFESFTSKASS